MLELAKTSVADDIQGRGVSRKFMDAGDNFCPTCGQCRQGGTVFVTAANADYLVVLTDNPSIEAIRARPTHVLTYLIDKDQVI